MGRLLRFGISGAFSALTHFGVMRACLAMDVCGSSAAYALGFAASFLVSFLLNRQWTFNSGAGTWGSLGRFSVATGMSFLLAQAAFTWLVTIAGAEASQAFLLAFPIPPVSNYLLGRYYVFRT